PEAVGGVVRVALAYLDVRVGDAELRLHDLGEGRFVPLSLRLYSELENTFAGGMDAQLRRVEHADADDVVLAPRAGAHDLREGGEADAHELAARALLPLLLQQILVAELLQAEVHGPVVVAAVVLPAGGRLVGELLLLDEVAAGQL